MFWFIVIVLIIVVIVAAFSGPSPSQAASVVQSFARMMASERQFREYWRFMHLELIGQPLQKHSEDIVVQNYLADFLDLMAQVQALTPENVTVMLPAFAAQGTNLDIKIASSISAEFGKEMANTSKADRATKRFMKDVLGLKV